MTPPQSHHWSNVAADYEKEFVDPYRADARNPLFSVLRRLAGTETQTAADLGCGIGPLLPTLAARFGTVHAVDFAEGMLARARERCRGLANVQFWARSFTDLAPLHGALDVAVSVNSLVLPDVREIDKALDELRLCLKPGGRFLGIVPAMDGVHYYTMLALDRALAGGMPLDAARKNAAHHAEHEYYDFAFGQFTFRGIEQHFWQPFEVRHRLRKAGFERIRLRKAYLSWQHFALRADLQRFKPSWDWYFQCRRPVEQAAS